MLTYGPENTLVPLFTWLYGPEPESHVVHLCLSVDAHKQLFVRIYRLRTATPNLPNANWSWCVFRLLPSVSRTYYLSLNRGSIALKRPAFFTCLAVTYGY